MQLAVIDMKPVSEQISLQQQPISQRGDVEADYKDDRCHQPSEQEGKRIAQIGAHIRALRINSGYTSAEIFAYEHDLNRISYWRMEKGSNITMSSLFRILDIHQITLSEFFKEID